MKAKAVIKDNAHKTGWNKEKKHKNMKDYFKLAFKIYMRPWRDIAGQRSTVTLHSHYGKTYTKSSIYLILLLHRLKGITFFSPETQEWYVHREACLILVTNDKELYPYE